MDRTMNLQIDGYTLRQPDKYMYRYMNGYIDGQIDGQMDISIRTCITMGEQIDCETDRQIDRYIHRQIDTWMDGGWMDEQTQWKLGRQVHA